MTILTALAAFNERLQARGDTAGGGYETARIAFALDIADPQRPVLADLRTPTAKRPEPRSLSVPVWPERRTSGIKPFFLWDKTAYCLGVTALEGPEGPRPGQGKRTAEEHAAFVALHREILAGEAHPAFQALLAFLDWWRPEFFVEPVFKPEALDQNLVFSIGRTYLHELPEAHALWEAMTAPEGETQRCLVTGRQGTVARVHPAVKGVPGAQSSGASLVSFNLGAFDSYGKTQGDNAPVSEAAAQAYGSALNWLLDRRHRRVLRLGDTSLVFWADERPGAERAESLLAIALGGFAPEEESDLDESEAARVRQVLTQVSEGRAVRQAAPDLDPATRVHLLGLAPNNARLSVRLWLEDSFGNLFDRLAEHWQALHLEPQGKERTPAVWMLLDETALRVGGKPKRDTIPPRLAGELLRAVLTGRPYPRTLLSAVVQRVRADGLINQRRAALIKAVLHRLPGEETLPVSLDPDNRNPAYRLGRLFALIENAQEAALPGLSATVKDRYFGAACATPARVFPLLHKNAMNHLAVIRKGEHGGLAHWMEKEMGAVWSGLSDELPRSLRLEEQGRFIAGYYHQRYYRKPKEEAAPVETAPEPATPAEED